LAINFCTAIVLDDNDFVLTAFYFGDFLHLLAFLRRFSPHMCRSNYLWASCENSYVAIRFLHLNPYEGRYFYYFTTFLLDFGIR